MFDLDKLFKGELKGFSTFKFQHLFENSPIQETEREGDGHDANGSAASSRGGGTCPGISRI